MNLSQDAKKRDEYTCQKCGEKYTSSSRLEAHHIIPQAFDGPDSLDNLSTLCKPCHRYAPDDLLSRSEFESVFEEYISTGTRPEIDFAYFGAKATDIVDGEPDTILVAYNKAQEILRSLDERGYPSDRFGIWFMLANMADYGNITEAKLLSEEEIQRYI